MARMLLACLIAGILLGFAYDFLRLSHLLFENRSFPCAEQMKQRLALPHALRLLPFQKKKRVGVLNRRLAVCVIGLEDVVFSLLFFVVLILTLYATADGQFRISALAAQLLGFFLYLWTIGRVTLPVYATVVVALKAGIAFLFAVLSYVPIRCCLWLLAKISPIMVRGCRFVIAALQHCKQVAFKRRATKKIKPSEKTKRPEPDGKRVFCFGRSTQV